jgi:hypothetical protein
MADFGSTIASADQYHYVPSSPKPDLPGLANSLVRFAGWALPTQPSIEGNGQDD